MQTIIGDYNLLYLVLAFPLIGFLINILFGKFMGELLVSLVGCAVVLVSFGLSSYIFVEHFLNGTAGWITSSPIRWIDVGTFSIDIALFVDQLTIIMMLVVTGVGSLIHIYSAGYMHGDERFNRYFSYINLFTFFMLLLIMGKNLFILFVGWEGVGLCSYLLIGFWFDNKEKGISNSLAGMKAFIVNRVGDLSFTIGVFILFTYLGDKFGVWTVDLPTIKQVISANSDFLNIGLITVICILLFGGACGKSAQIPLYVWLPDAMAGPTPVSALIHAATMVTAGVYMVARLNFLYSLSAVAMGVVAIVGAATALFAAAIAITQNDIKKVLAYSTVSQLGYMFLACGVGAYIAAIFHLMTHAFFKACLFLGSGSVIHGCEGEQDMRKMGGLRKKMPITFVTFLVATLAIAGIPPLAGFFSKDEILWKAFSAHSGLGKLVWGIGFLTALMTAFYMLRLLFMTFFGSYRGDKHVHESPPSMLFALIALAMLSVVGGLVGIPDALGETLGIGKTNVFEHFMAAVVPVEHGVHHSVMEFILMFLSVGVGLLGIYIAYLLYVKKPKLPSKISERVRGLYEASYNKFFVDEIYDAVIIKPVVKGSVQACRFDNAVIDGTVNGVASSTGRGSLGIGRFDNSVVDGMVNGIAGDVYNAGGKLKYLQTGNVKMYLTIAVVTSILIIISLWSLFKWEDIFQLLGLF